MTDHAARRLPGFGTQVLLGLLAGALLGLWARELGSDNVLAETLRTLGSLFVQLLKALVPPIIVTAIIASIAALRELRDASKLVISTLFWFALTSLIAVLIGITLGLIIEPGVHSGVAATLAQTPTTQGGWLDFLKGLVPSNVLGLTASTSQKDDGLATILTFNALQLIVIAVAVGAAAVRLGERSEAFLAFNASALAIFRKLLVWVIRLTPIGTAGLIGDAIVRYGWTALGSLGHFAIAVYAGLGIVLLVIYPILLRLHGLSPLAFFRHAWPAIQVAFVSRSSIGTLPVTELVTERGLGVPASYAAFAVPLGATTKMDGCAVIYPAIAAIFVAQFYGLPLGFESYALIVLVSVLGSAATVGLPLEGVGLLLAIDPILDMGRTAVNVAGQALVPTIVAKRNGILDEACFHSHAPAGELLA